METEKDIEEEFPRDELVCFLCGEPAEFKHELILENGMIINLLLCEDHDYLSEILTEWDLDSERWIVPKGLTPEDYRNIEPIEVKDFNFFEISIFTDALRIKIPFN